MMVLAASVAVVVSACPAGSTAATALSHRGLISGSQRSRGPKLRGAGQNVTLTMWVHTDPNYMDVAKANAAEYEQETGVQIDLSYVPWDQYGVEDRRRLHRRHPAGHHPGCCVMALSAEGRRPAGGGPG